MAKKADEPKAKVALNPDGSLSPPKAERLALLLADEVTPYVAWPAIGGSHKGWSGQDKKAFLADPVFKTRLEDLVTEREALEADPIWGKARWMVEQLWREARATGDNILAKQAAEMRLSIAIKSSAGAPAQTAGSMAPAADDGEGGPQSGPGRPLTERPKAVRDVSDITNRLLGMGLQEMLPAAAVDNAA